jgi:hypothetical protein
MMTTGSTTSGTNNTLSTLQKQNQLNRSYDNLPTPTSITGEEVVSENGYIAINYSGTGGFTFNKLNKNKFNKFNKKSKKSKKKVYKIMGYPHVNKNYGNFTGSWPAQAAHKALTILSRKINLKNSDDMNQIKFWIIEKKTGKKYCYIGSRIKLVRPNIIINKNGKKVKFWHKTTLRKCEFKGNKNH